MRHGLIVLSAIVGLATAVTRRGRRSRVAGPPSLRLLALVSTLIGLGMALRDGTGRRRGGACEDDRDRAERRCLRYEDQGYATCGRYEDRGYAACSRYEDQGYNACSRYEDRGYNSCREWKKNCCDWWPCSWACEIISWVCVAWVWVSNLVCVAWVWVSNLVCVAWVWVTHLVCVLWIWITSRVCVLWAWIVYPFCWLWCWLRRLFTGNEVSEVRSECIYGWTAAYRITEERDCRLHVEVRVRLQPDADVTAAEVQAVQAAWEPVVERIWAEQHDILLVDGGCDCERYTVTFDLRWVTSGEHHVVQLHSGSGRADMGNFFVTDSGEVIAHEVGHMIGNPDEYTDPACPGRTVTSDNSIMQTTAGSVRRRHYAGFAQWISSRTCCTYEVAPEG